jgi:hypothetical protein
VRRWPKSAYDAAERAGTPSAFRLVARKFPNSFWGELAAQRAVELENVGAGVTAEANRPAPNAPAPDPSGGSATASIDLEHLLRAAPLTITFDPSLPRSMKPGLEVGNDRRCRADPDCSTGRFAQYHGGQILFDAKASGWRFQDA